MSEDQQTESTARAASALVAYFNYDLATKLVDRVLSEKSKVAMQKLADAVLDLLPRAAQGVLWTQVRAFCELKGSQHVASEAFQKTVVDYIARQTNSWMEEVVDKTVREAAARIVREKLKPYDMQQYLKEFPGRFKVEFERNIAELAKEVARTETEKVAPKGKRR